MSGSVFRRNRSHNLPVATRATGCWIETVDGRRILDGAGGAIVCGIGHGRPEVTKAMAAALGSVDYVHATTFTTAATEEYAAAIARHAPVDRGRVFPVSGGSEATETAIKLARTFHLAAGRPNRTVILSRHGSYHGNTLGALDLSGRPSLREDFEPWLGRWERLPPVNEYRCPNGGHPLDCAEFHTERLRERIATIGPDRVAAVIAEPIGGATLGATAPPEGYWPGLRRVCNEFGVLLIADEVMTGFGRTGQWFGVEHSDTSPDIVVAGKGASSGYWPLGLCIASRTVWEMAAASFRHGFTFSHHPVGAAVGLTVLQILEGEGLIGRSGDAGHRLATLLTTELGDHPHVGDIRGRGLLIALEFVSDRTTREPFDRSRQITERVVDAAFDLGVTVYPAAGCADGRSGDAILLGPPLTITDDEMALLAERVTAAIHRTTG